MSKNIEGVIIISKVVLSALGFCGIVPLHSIPKCDLYRKSIQLIYTLILITLAVTIKIFLICKTETRTENYRFAELLQFVIAEFTWIFTAVQSYRNRLLWCKVIKNVFNITRIRNCNWDWTKLVKCPIFYVLTISIGVHILNILSSSFLRSVPKIDLQISCLVRNLICIRIILLVYFLKEEYHRLSQQLSLIVEEEEEKVMDQILSIKKAYMELDDLIQDFNYLNGHQILLVIAFSSLQILNATIFSLSYFKNADTLTFVLKLLLPYIATVVNLFYMMDCCNAVKEASGELLRTIYQVDSRFSIFSEQFLELKSFSKLIYFHRTKISAADYFDINRLTIFYFLYNTSTYFVVLVQFYNNKQD